MGNIVRKACGCGRLTRNKGLDKQGRTMYSSSCNHCREEARQYKKTYCEWCFVEADKGTLLDVDHIDGNRSNNLPSNLQTLCRQCHINKTKIFGDYAMSYRKEPLVDKKHCGGCNKEKSFDAFAKSSKTSDGVQGWCRECSSIYNKMRNEQRKSEPATVKKTSKTCITCKLNKPVSQFGKKTNASDKLMSYCKPCWTKYVQNAQRKAKRSSKN